MSRFVLFFIVTVHSSLALATTPLTMDKTPEQLKPWVEWVLQDEETYQCPFFYNNFQQKNCSWPGKLSLKLNSKQAQFISQWQVYKDSWVFLPGDQHNWPQNVRINNKAAVVINKQGKPGIKLAAGRYSITGFFYWQGMPKRLTIPKNTALLNLTINNKTIAYPAIKANKLWLHESDIGHKKPKSIENKLDIQVFRKVDDNIPLQLMTFLELEVSGEQREIILPHALLKQFIAVSLKSPLPARIEANGDLLLQIRPGRWHIELKARHPEALTEITLAIDDELWPESEIWSFKAHPFQRLVEIDQVKAIDPSQTNVPGQWKNLPAYLLKQGDSMAFKLIRRGDPEPEPNQLTLKRQLWLDFAGTAYTVSDQINGTMSKGWRLNAVAETQVGQVKLNGQPQLVTKAIENDKVGIELRKGQVNLLADSRIKGDIGRLSVTGWEQDFNQVKAELNIPPGWRLLAASGVDNVPNSWVAQWTLLDLFLVLIASLAVSRLWTVSWGVFTLISLVLCWHEPQAPHFIWLNILAAIALIRVLPAGRFQNMLKWYRNICWLSLLLILIPFMVAQIRIALYPQLEKHWQPISPLHYESVEVMEKQAMVGVQQDAIMRKSVSKVRQLASPATYASVQSKAKAVLLERIDADANIQTGPGLPQWQWNKVYLSWNGSVDSLQQISLWYLSPKLTMLLNFTRVALLIVLTVLIFGLWDKKFILPKNLLSLLFLIPLLTFPTQDAFASFPDQQLLDQLKSRLLKAPDCLPSCAQIPVMQLSISPENLSIRMQVHAQQDVGIPLPAALGQWMPSQVTVNGQQAKALIRMNSKLWLGLDKGVQSIELSGINPVQNKFSLPLALKPQRLTVESNGWTIEGVHQNAQADKQLILSRVKSISPLPTEKNKLEQGALPAFIRIERTLNLGLDWRMTTRVVRVVDNDAAVALKLPLLNNESVTTERIRVENKQVLVNLAARQTSMQWQSVLKKSSQIELIAAKTELWTEIWRANISPIWHLQTQGIAVVHHQDRGRWLPEWRPWPGEKVVLSLSRPSAVKGATLTVDRTDLQIKPGKRSIESELKLSIRSSKGTQHTIKLPDKAELQSVKIKGITQPIRQKNSQLTIPIEPGLQEIIILWRTMQQQANIFSSPAINIAIASVNHHLKVLLGQDRWVLLTVGPAFGPAVLFWGVLIVIAILSFALGKISLTPLKHWHWFLLLIGLSQTPIEFAMCVVAWLIALGFRARKQPIQTRYFNAMQIALAGLSLVSLLILFVAVQQGLLGSPDMQIVGNQSTAFKLNWYQDRSDELLPSATVISVSLMSYRILMLLWALWLAVSLLSWLKWGWSCFATNGLWKQGHKDEKLTEKSNM
mgnify:CR=1 FL=1